MIMYHANSMQKLNSMLPEGLKCYPNSQMQRQHLVCCFSMSSVFLSLLFPFCYADRLLLSSLVVNVVDNLLPFYFYEIR